MQQVSHSRIITPTDIVADVHSAKGKPSNLCPIVGNIENSTNYDVVVIGAGISGLASASFLQKSGLRVLVLEGRDRIGGRIHSAPFGNDIIDLGASWIHGIGPGTEIDDPEYDENYNPIYEITLQHRIPTVKTWNQYEEVKQEYYWWKGGKVDTAYSEFFDLYHDIKEWLDTECQTFTKDQSFADILSQFPISQSNDDQKIFYFIYSLLWGEWNGAGINELSAKSYDIANMFNGDERIFPGGYSQVPNAIAKDLNIVQNQVVTAIDYNDEIVVISTAGGITYSAPRVIVSVPIGVLKAGDIAFSPKLPPTKQAAIDRLGLGYMDKFVLEFEEVFWDKEVDLINYCSEEPGQWLETLNLYKYL